MRELSAIWVNADRKRGTNDDHSDIGAHGGTGARGSRQSNLRATTSGSWRNCVRALRENGVQNEIGVWISGQLPVGGVAGVRPIFDSVSLEDEFSASSSDVILGSATSIYPSNSAACGESRS